MSKFGAVKSPSTSEKVQKVQHQHQHKHQHKQKQNIKKVVWGFFFRFYMLRHQDRIILQST